MDHDVRLLVAPALLAVTEDLRVWHTGLVHSAAVLHLAVIMEPIRGENEATAALPSPRLRDLTITITATDPATAGSHHLVYGTDGGANPTMITRIAGAALSPAVYTLKIEFEYPEAKLAIDHLTHFTVRP